MIEPDHVVRQTADASTNYHERAAVDIARADSTANDGTIASFTRGNTLIVSTTTYYPVYTPNETVYVQQLVELVDPVYTRR
jgi:hypothetical protein